MTPEQKARLEAKIAQWNAESMARPGAKVRVYRLLENGDLGIEDKLRLEVELSTERG